MTKRLKPKDYTVESDVTFHTEIMGEFPQFKMAVDPAEGSDKTAWYVSDGKRYYQVDEDPVRSYSNLHDSSCAKVCLNPYHEGGEKAIDVKPINLDKLLPS